MWNKIEKMVWPMVVIIAWELGCLLLVFVGVRPTVTEWVFLEAFCVMSVAYAIALGKWQPEQTISGTLITSGITMIVGLLIVMVDLSDIWIPWVQIVIGVIIYLITGICVIVGTWRNASEIWFEAAWHTMFK